MSALAPGSKLGRYEVRSLIGAGGMGEVYRARDPELGRDVAIKVLPRAFSADLERLRRFEQEARAAGTLNHPNIVAIYDVGSREESPYVVTELLEGETLRDEIARGALPRRQALGYAGQIAQGLATAHDKGVVHRDLKPENLFVCRDGRVKILDFGLAKLTQAHTSGAVATAAPTATLAPVTEPGVVMGTVGYMAPEQVRGEPADHRADVFSFGAVLYEMLTGHRAFRRDSTVETMAAILKNDPPELAQPSSAIDAPLERLLRHCLEKRPEARFQSMRDLAFGLESLSLFSGVTASPSVAATATGGVKPRRRDFLVGGALLAAGSAATFVVGRRFGPGPATSVVPEFQQLTFRQGTIGSARFASDGHTVLYSARWLGEPGQVYSTRAESPESRAVGVADSSLLAVSSTGELALLLEPRGRSVLARMPMTGSAPRELLDDAVAADWSPDGSNLAVVRQNAEGSAIEFPLGTTLYRSSSHLGPSLRFSPTGGVIACVEDDKLCLVDRSGRKTTIAALRTQLADLSWSPRGEIWYSRADVNTLAPTQRLYAVTVEGEERLVWRAIGLRLADIAPDGRALFTVQTQRKGIAFGGAGSSGKRISPGSTLAMSPTFRPMARPCSSRKPQVGPETRSTCARRMARPRSSSAMGSPSVSRRTESGRWRTKARVHRSKASHERVSCCCPPALERRESCSRATTAARSAGSRTAGES